ncbi:hypothetical protein GEMRC1_008929 [Eukaryota sp. GEM-RC1]
MTINPTEQDRLIFEESADFATAEQRPYGNFTFFCLTMNYIIGTGVLGIPYAFSITGIRLSIIVTLFVGLLSFISFLYLSEAMTRADAINDMLDGDLSNSLVTASPMFRISSRKFEVPHLVELFLGGKWKAAYQVAITLYMSTALISYASTSAGSLMTNFFFPGITTSGECNSNLEDWSSNCFLSYLCFLGIYSIIVISLTMVGLSGQGMVQNFFTIYRYLVFFICIVTVIFAIFDQDYPTDSLSLTPHIKTVPDWQWSSLGVIIPTLYFANIGQHSLPALASPLKDKSAVQKNLIWVICVLTVVYVVLSTTSVLYFGSNTGELLSLMWKTYNPWGHEHQAIWAKILVQLVVLFVPVACLSAYPINAITLGNNIFESVLPAHRRDMCTPKYVKKVQRLCLLFCSLPPIFLSIFARRFSSILSFGGLTGFFIAMIIPALLHLASRERCISCWNLRITERNPYSSFVSKPFFAYILIYIGIAASILTSISLFRTVF